MSLGEVQDLFKVRFTGPGNTPINWPQDIIDNTIKAYSRDINGFTQGEPTGRYFAPAGLDGCIETSVGSTTLADWEITGANGPRVIQLVTRFSW